MFCKTKLIFVAAVAAVLSTAPAQAAVVWTGTTGTSASWADTVVWSTNVIPTSTDDVAFDSSLDPSPFPATTLDGNQSILGLSYTTIQDLTIGPGSSSSYTLTTGSNGISQGSAAGYLGITAGVVLGAPQTWTIDGANAQVSGVISDNSLGYGLIKAGTGQLTLTSANTYGGGTTISAGTLAVSGSGTLGATSGSLALTGGALGLGSTSQTVGGLSVSGGGGSISGGTLATTGAATVNSGTLTLGSGVNLAAGSGLSVTGGQIAAADGTATLTGSLSYTSSANSTFAGVIAGAASTVTLNNPSATLTLSGNNTFGGQLSVQNGTLAIGTINNISAAGPLGNNALSVILGSSGQTGTLDYTGATASSTKKFTMATGGSGAIQVDGSGTNLTLSGVIDGSGAMQKTGTGTLTLSGVNTFAGQLTVQQGTLSVNSINQASANGTLGNAGVSLPVILGSSGNTGTLQYTGGNTASITKPFTLATGGTGVFEVTNSATTVTLDFSNSSVIGGAGNLLKTGPGTLTLFVNDSNYGIIPVPQFTGVTKITGGKIKYSSSGFNNGDEYTLFNSAYDTTGSTGGVGLDITGATNPWFGGLAGNENLATAIAVGYGSVASLNLNLRSGNSYTYGGVIANGTANMTFSKQGYGTQTLTASTAYTGATTVRAGTLALGGANGSILNSAVTVRGGTLLLDNSSAWANRLADATALSLGSLTLNSYSGAGTQTETVGATTFAVGGKMTINNGASGTDTTTLTMNGVTRSAGAAIDFVGTGGTLGNGANNPNVTSTGAWPNASGGAGTWILPYATVSGTQWAEDNANSIRPYSGAFVALAGATSAQNAQETAGSTLGGAATANSLNIASSGSGTQTLALGANNLTLGSGTATPAAILKSGSDAWVINGTGQVRAGSGGAGTELIAHVDGGDLTISAPLNTAVVGLAKGGTGKLVLSGARAATMSGAIGIVGSLEFQGNTTSLTGVISGPGSLIANLNPGQILTINNTGNSYAGSTVAKGGILNIAPAWNSQGLPGGNSGQFGTSNLEINNAIVSLSYYMSMGMGPGPGQFQITGGTTGFSANGNDVIFNIFGRSSYEVVWGSDYFKPDVLVLQEAAASPGMKITWNNLIDLNGTTRTIAVTAATTATTLPSLAGVIRTSSGTAGLTKTGVGELALTAANTFNGPVTVSGGILTISTLVNGGAASGLGMSSSVAANLLLANGTTLKYITGGAVNCDRSFTINGTAAGDSATLDASGAGAVNFTNTACPAYGTADQTRTLFLAGTYTGNNTLAANLADNGLGAVSVTKTGAGLWILSGANAYTGTTTLSAGELSVSTSGNLGAASAPLVFSGGGLQVTGVSLTNFASLGRTVTFNAGKTVTLDINNAANVFTQDLVFNQGAGGLTKLGAGTLVLNLANTYSGVTTMGGGVLSLAGSAALAGGGNLSFSGGTLQFTAGNTTDYSAKIVNSTGAIALDTNNQSVTFAGAIDSSNTGGLKKIGLGTLALNAPTYYSGTTTVSAGTLTLANNLAIQNSVLDTNSAGTINLVGMTTPTFGGLSGGVNLSTVLGAPYSSVTALTVNPVSGATASYGGVISDGSAGMTLTMIGLGTQVLTASNTYTGQTVLNAGTLNLSGSGSILSSAGITLSGGGLTLTNTVAETGSGRLPDGAPITSNGGTFTYNNTSGAAIYAETAGTVALTSGQLNVVLATSQTNTGYQTLTLSGLTHTGSANASAVTFSAAGTGPQASGNKNMVVVTGGGTTTTGQIIGPWATTGTAAASQTDHAVYNAGYVVPANIAASAETTWTNSANAYTLSSTAAALTASRTIAALRYTGGAGTLALGTNNLQTYGLLNGGTGALTVSGGTLTTPTGGGSLYLTGGNSTITVTAPINDNGGAVTVVKNGSSTVILDSAASNFGGGIVVDAGTLQIANNTANSLGGGTYNANIFLSGGATLAVWSTANQTLGGIISGDGSVTKAYGNTLTLSGANTYTGKTSITPNSTAGGTLSVSSINSVLTDPTLGTVHSASSSMGAPTTVANGTIDIGAGNQQAACTLIYTGTGETTDRVIRLNTNNNTSYHTITANGTGLLKFTSQFIRTGNGINALRLNGTGDGEIVAPVPAMVGGVIKEGTDTWTLDGANLYLGSTTINGGSLVINNAAGIPGGVGAAGGTSAVVFNGGVLGLGSVGDFTRPLDATTNAAAANFTGNGGWAAYGADRVVNLGGASATIVWSATNTGFNGKTLILGASSATSKVTLQNPLDLGNVVRTVQVDNGAAVIDGELSGPLSGAGGGLTKTGTGTLLLSGSNTYTGLTTVSAGVLNIQHASALGTTAGSTTVSSGAALQLQGGISVAAEPLSLNGAGISNTGALRNVSGNNIYGGPITLAGATRINSDSGTLTLDVASGNAISGTQSVTFGGAGNITVADPIATGSGNLTKDGGGTLILAASNSYSGSTNVTQGMLLAKLPGSLASANYTKVSVAPAATLAVNGDPGGWNLGDDLPSLVTTGSFAAGSTLGIEITGTSSNSCDAADLTGTQTAKALLKLGGGTLSLGGTGAYTGGTTVNEGTLNVTAPDALTAGGNLAIASGGHVVLSSGLSHAISLGGLTITSGAGASFGAGLPTPPASGAWSGDRAPTPEGQAGSLTYTEGQAGSLTYTEGQAGSLTYGSAAPTPEPGTLLLLAAGAIAGLAAWRRRKIAD